MYVSRLQLQDFRIYRSLNLALPPGVCLFYGANAAGKTTILEALYYLATTRSLRASVERELIALEAAGDLGLPPFARLAASLQPQPEAEMQTIEIVLQRKFGADGDLAPTTSKSIRINKIARRALDLIGQLRVVMFAPQDLELVTGAPAERRRYLDVTLSQIDGRYVRALSRYNQVLTQRNGLLRTSRERGRAASEQDLAFWDEELAKAGVYVLRERRRAVTTLDQLAQRLYAEISGSDLDLRLNYLDTTPAHDVPSFQAALKQLRREERERGVTLIGPHRDDLSIQLAEREVGSFGSRGQQRASTLALRLAEAELMHSRTGDRPVLLLDDLLSELDQKRREQLLTTIVRPQQQTLITATDLDDFSPNFLSQITRMHVDHGQIFPA